MKLVAVFLFLSFIGADLYSQEFNFLPERIIGSYKDDHYIFYRISDIKFTGRGGFLVADKRRKRVSLYNSRGKYVNRLKLGSVDILGVGKRHIYVCEPDGKKLNLYSPQLRYQKSVFPEYMPEKILTVYNDGSFLGTLDTGFEGRIMKVSPGGTVVDSFFNQCWWGKMSKGYSIHEFINRQGLAGVKGGYEAHKIIFGFRESDNPTKVFVYSERGRKLQTMSYRGSGPYKLNPCSCTAKGAKERFSPEKREEIRHHVEFSSAFFFKDYRIVFLKYVDADWCMRDTRRNMFLVFNSKGELLHEEDLCNDLTFFDIDENGRVIGADLKADKVTVQIYRIEVENKTNG